MKTIFLFGGTLSLAAALDQTGAGELISDKVIGLLGKNPSPYVLTFVIFMLCCVLTNFMSNTATTALMAPIAVSTIVFAGIQIGVAYAHDPPMTHAISTALGSAPIPCAIDTAGGYTFKDYAKAGVPLILVSTVVSMILLPIFYPFFP